MEFLSALLVFGGFFAYGLWGPAWRARWSILAGYYEDRTAGVPIREASFGYQSCRLGALPAQLAVELKIIGVSVKPRPPYGMHPNPRNPGCASKRRVR